MIWNLFLASALAGTVIIDNEIPVEVRIEQRTVMKLLYSAQARFEHSPGKTQLTLLVNGKPKEIAVDIPETGSVRVIVGRNGISHTVDQTPVEAKEQTEVVFRALGSEPLQLRLGTKRHIVTPDAEFSTTLPTGRHPIEVRNLDGTLLWAAGQLELSGLEQVIVQLVEGRMPEVIGHESQFYTRGR